MAAMVRSCIITLLLISFGVFAGPKLWPAENNSEQAEAAKPQVGLGPGDVAPPFKASDQFGKEQTYATVAGKNGTVLLFFRSADW